MSTFRDDHKRAMRNPRYAIAYLLNRVRISRYDRRERQRRRRLPGPSEDYCGRCLNGREHCYCDGGGDA